MAHYRLPGPTCSWSQNLQVDNGDSALGPGCPRGPVDGAAPGHASELDPRTLWRRASAVHEACAIGLARAPEAIVRATGLDDLPALGESLIEGALVLMAAVGVAGLLGGAAGAVVGGFFGGVGAVPGAAVGAQFGVDAAIAVLGWLGLAFLAVAIGRGLMEVSGKVTLAVGQAWDAEGRPQRQEEVQAAGQLLADAIGQLMLLIVMAVVARLSASQAGTATARAAGTAEDLYAALRQSRLGAGFADWVQANAQRLLSNPRLRMHNVVGGTGGKSGETLTPSQLKQSREPLSASPTKPLATEPTPLAATRARKPRQPTTRNTKIDQARTVRHADGSTTYFDKQGRAVTYSKEGYADFTPHAEAEVQINGLKGKFPPDDVLANKAVGLESTPKDYTWHHVQDGKTMQLIPTDIHQNFPHTGGASLLRGR